MRATIPLLAACLALLTTSVPAQQPDPAPGPAEAAPPPPSPPQPAVQPASPQGASPTGTDDPWGVGGQAPAGAGSPAAGPVPTIHLRYRGVVLDLPCSANADTAACARTALEIVDHLRRGDPGDGASADVRRRERDGYGRDRGERGSIYGRRERGGYRDRGDRDDYDGDEGEGEDDDER
jgi:hypothetical protein